MNKNFLLFWVSLIVLLLLVNSIVFLFHSQDYFANKDTEIIMPDSLNFTHEGSLEISPDRLQQQNDSISAYLLRIYADAELVDIQTLDSNFVVQMAYASDKNFTHKNLYGNLNKAFLRKEIAIKLARAQQFLHERNPAYRLLVLDAARPLSVQQQLWNAVKGKPEQDYVEDPLNGSAHNFGAAVDVSIVDENGNNLDMGTPYNYFGDKAQPKMEGYFVQKGNLNKYQLQNRSLLRDIMRQAGFTPVDITWWHFDGISLRQAVKKYKRLE
ncbi:MAG: M15 family metallopeptidase [Chitinophagales bacterium]|nr:M15 family metallopeptidase [Bacteroidota bacterium]